MIVNFKYLINSFFNKLIYYFLKLFKKNHKLKYISNCIIPEIKEEIRLFAVFRNELIRLPHFIKYYQNLGVDRFFLIDNNSSDGSMNFLLNKKDIHVFKTSDSYVNHWTWIEWLLESYGKGKWCLVVDIDELFSYPNSSSINLKSLKDYLQMKNYTSINSKLLDMYSDKEINNVKINSGDNPLDVLNYFENNLYESQFIFFDKKNKKKIEIKAFTGGMRERYFGLMHPQDILSKVPFFQYNDKVYLVQGMHAISNTKSADIEGVVFHTKFLNDFIEEVIEESAREQHWNNAIRYKHYADTILNNSSLNLFHTGSIKYENDDQLVELGLLKTSDQFENFCKNYKS
jgi:hypothetical protein